MGWAPDRTCLAAFGIALAALQPPPSNQVPPVAPDASPPVAASETAAPVDLQALLEDYRSLRPDPRGLPVRDRTARIGHLELAFAEGTLFPLRTRHGAVLGFFFDGAGRYSYRSEDSADRLVLAANCHRETTAPIYYNHAVRDTFKRTVVLFAVPLFEDLIVPAPPDGASLADGQRSDFDRIWKRIESTYLEFDHLAVEARLNGGGRQYVYAEMEGGHETAGYMRDQVGDFNERLVLFRKIQGVDVRFVRPLSAQEIDGGEPAHPSPLALKEAHLDVSTRNNRLADITSDLTFEATTDGVRIARLALLNNRDPDHYHWASAENRLVVRRITDEAGRALPFSHRYHGILILLPRALARGDAQRLHFETEGEILTGMHGRRYDNYFDLSYEPWFPRPVLRSSASLRSTLKVRTRSPFRPIASGETVAFRHQGDEYELETKSDAPASEIVVFAGKYRTNEERAGDVTIRAHGYAAALRETLEKLPRVAGRLLGFFGDALGPYPFGDLDIIEVPVDQDIGSGALVAFGIAPASLVLMSSEAFNPYRGTRGPRSSGAALMSRGVNARLAHEIAHQWFPHQAMPAGPRDRWLSESFAEYLAGLAIASTNPDPRQVLDFQQMFSGWQFEARGCRDAGSLETATMLGGESAFRDYTCLMYNRGPLVLHMLRTLVGNDRFFAIMRRFLARGREGPVTTEDFGTIVTEVLQIDMGWFIDQWYRQGGIPEIKVTYRVAAVGADNHVLTGRAEQAEGPAFKKIHIPLVLDLDGGRQDLRLVFQDAPVKEFRFDLRQKPRKVTVDPHRNNLADYH